MNKNAQYQAIYRGKNSEKLAYAKLVNRIKSGVMPQQATLVKFDITDTQLNELRKNAGHAPVNTACISVNPRTTSGENNQVCPPSFSWKALHDYMWQLIDSGIEKTSRYKTYFGSRNGYEAGFVYNVLKTAGFNLDVNDIRPYLSETTKIMDAARSLGGKKGIQLDRVGAILVMIKQHPELRKLKKAYADLDAAFRRFNNAKEAEDIERRESETITLKYPQLVDKVSKKYGKASEEYLLLKMFYETPSRFEILKLNVGGTTGNRIIIPPKGNVQYIFEKYKTVAIFGKVQGVYSAATSKLIRAYTNKGKSKLFTAPNFIKNMLDNLGIERTETVNTGTINLLRKIYVSTHLTPKAKAGEREKIALLMRHSPLTSLKYLRDFKGDIPKNTPEYKKNE